MGYTLVIDNYDSFTWNIYADIATLGGNPLVRRNDKISISEIEVSSGCTSASDPLARASKNTEADLLSRRCSPPVISTG